MVIRVDENEVFPISTLLLDEASGTYTTGATVLYDVRYDTEAPLSPPVSGTLSESSVEAGIYTTTISIPQAGKYFCYVTCSGFLPVAEEILVNPENIYELTKANKSYNISVEDVVRTTAEGNETASQLSRKVPYGLTDYIINIIKNDDDVDWGGTTTSGWVYAHYESTTSVLPFKMGGEF